MQALLDFAPLAAFFVAFRIAGIYVATAVLMFAMIVLVLLDWVRLKRIAPMHALSTVLVLVLGGATLVLRDVRFLKWKPTVLLWLIGIAALLSPWIGRIPLSQRLLQPVVSRSEVLPRSTWLNLNWLWVAFCALLGAANLWLAFNVSLRAWVYFKVGGLTLAFMLFTLAQALWLAARTQSLDAPAA